MQDLRIIDNTKQLAEALCYLLDKDFVSYDTETTGLLRTDACIGISFCAEPNVAYYIVLKAWDPEIKSLVDIIPYAEVKGILNVLSTKQLLMHNAIFDSIRTKLDFGIDLIQAVHTDTAILGHLLDENRSNKLKDLAVSIFGQSSKQEQEEMHVSIKANGGTLTKKKYELYKADSYLIAKYGAKDALLTFNLFHVLIEDLYAQNLQDFFFEESMPLLRGPTFDLNFIGLKIDPNALTKLKLELQANMAELHSSILTEIHPYVKDLYPGTTKKNTFNIGSNEQLSWLLFHKLGQDMGTLTDVGKDICSFLGLKLPYSVVAKRDFIRASEAAKGKVYVPEGYDHKKKKVIRAKKINNWWKYTQCDKELLTTYAKRYKWVAKLLEYKKESKLLTTYVEGIQSKMLYNVIYPSFNQMGTTSGRYSSSQPNFQNLPREDKRIKSCIVARPGKVFVGADEEQLEPRVFSSISEDETLTGSFAKGEDFYAVVGMPVFGIFGCSLFKSDENSFAKKYPKERDRAKVFGLATPYGRLASVQAQAMHIHKEEAQQLIDRYFEEYPKVKEMMLDSHRQAKEHGIVYSLFGRPRRIPAAQDIDEIYGNAQHANLPYDARNLLNLAMNHRVQSTAASIVNRASIAFHKKIIELGISNPAWNEVKLVLQIHDQLIAEVPEKLQHEVCTILQNCMENAVTLPKVKLVAIPVVSTTIAGQK